MRIGRVIGNVTITRRLSNFVSGRLLLVEALDAQAVRGLKQGAPRKSPMPESLVVYDELGAGAGEIIAISEGREAAMPFWPELVPIDAYCAAILDNVEWQA